jgi:hypothetical protein
MSIVLVLVPCAARNSSPELAQHRRLPRGAARYCRRPCVRPFSLVRSVVSRASPQAHPRRESCPGT